MRNTHAVVFARNGESVESLIRRFSRKVKNEGIIDEFKEKQYYEKPSVKRRREKLRRQRVIRKLFKENSRDK